MRRGQLQVLVLLAGGVTLGGSAPQPPALGGAQLGMSLASWQALPPPAGTPKDVKPVCQSASSEAGPVKSCEYASTVGKYVFPQGGTLGPGIDARQVKYIFAGGRLSAIEYWASVDAFDPVLRRLTARYGAPAKVLRDDVRTEVGPLPRVRDIWSTAGGKVELDDPAPPYDVLKVTLGQDPLASRKGG